MITKTLTVLLTAALAVQAAPHVKRQGVTALISSGSAPPGCRTVSTSLFGIGIHQATGVPKATSFAKRQVTQASDAQPAGTPITQGTDGQPAATPVTQGPDAQPAAATSAAPAVTQGSDAQPAIGTSPVTVISDGQPQAPASTMTMMPISQIHDGQAQAYYSPVSQISDGQIRGSTATGIAQKTDGQPQVPTSAATQKTDGQPGAGVTQATDAQPGATSTATPNVQMVACKNNSTLELTIENGVLYDGKRRQGYIAANYQFQFDAGVPQTGAIITAGFSLCENGSLALGGSAVFWQCLSGTFYNLYDRDWAFQCEPVFLTALDLINC